jgi:hypothetical protein
MTRSERSIRQRGTDDGGDSDSAVRVGQGMAAYGRAERTVFTIYGTLVGAIEMGTPKQEKILSMEESSRMWRVLPRPVAVS